MMSILHGNTNCRKAVSVHKLDDFRSHVVRHQKVDITVGKNGKQPSVVNLVMCIEAFPSTLSSRCVRGINEHDDILDQCNRFKHLHSVGFAKHYAVRVCIEFTQPLYQRLGVPTRCNALAVLSNARERCSVRQNASTTRSVQDERAKSVLNQGSRHAGADFCDVLSGGIEAGYFVAELVRIGQSSVPEGSDVPINFDKNAAFRKSLGSGCQRNGSAAAEGFEQNRECGAGPEPASYVWNQPCLAAGVAQGRPLGHRCHVDGWNARHRNLWRSPTRGRRSRPRLDAGVVQVETGIGYGRWR